MKKCIVANVLLLILGFFVQLSQAAQLPGPSIHDVLPIDIQQLIVAKAIYCVDPIQAVKTYHTLEVTSKKFKSLLAGKIEKDQEIVKLDILNDYIVNLQEAQKDYAKRRFVKDALHKAIEKKDYKALCILLSTYKFDINKKNERDETPIFLAAKLGHTKIVKELLTYKPNVNILKNGEFPIGIAIRKGHKEIQEALFKYQPYLIFEDKPWYKVLFSKIGKNLEHIAFSLKMFEIFVNFVNP